MRQLFLMLPLAALVTFAGCAVGVGYGGEAEYDGGFYEPYGYEYGGWEGGYRVGPHWRDGRGHDGGPAEGRNPGGHARPYRAAPPGRAMPSIPGGHGGPSGGHPGGGHH